MENLIAEIKRLGVRMSDVGDLSGAGRENASMQLHGHRPLQDRVRIAAERLIADAERAQAIDVANSMIAAGDLDGAARVLDHAGLALGQEQSAEGPATAGPST